MRKEEKTHLLRLLLQHSLVRNLLQPAGELCVMPVQLLVRFTTGDGDFGGVGDDDVVAAVVCLARAESGWREEMKREVAREGQLKGGEERGEGRGGTRERRGGRKKKGNRKARRRKQVGKEGKVRRQVSIEQRRGEEGRDALAWS